MGLKYGGRSGSLPVAENLASRLLRLPLYYDLSDSDQSLVIGCVSEFLRRTKVEPSNLRLPERSLHNCEV